MSNMTALVRLLAYAATIETDSEGRARLFDEARKHLQSVLSGGRISLTEAKELHELVRPAESRTVAP